MPTLYALSGPDIGRTYPVSDGCVIGRATDCDVVLHATSVSRRHARLEQRGERWEVLDLDSRNGLFHDGRRLKRLSLADGILFQLGDLELRFRMLELDLEHQEDLPLPSTRHAASPVSPAPPPPAEPEPRRRVGGGEIELEGEEFLDAPSRGTAPEAPPAAPPGPADSAPGAGATPGTGARRRQTASVDRALARQAVLASTARMTGAPGQGGIRDASRPVLQYSKQADRPGFFSADLGQYPLWVRVLAGLVALALFVAIFLVAFRSMGFLKERGAGDSAVEAPDRE